MAYIEKCCEFRNKEFNITQKLREAFGSKELKINIQNDGKCAALAEKYKGSLKDYNDCVFCASVQELAELLSLEVNL